MTFYSDFLQKKSFGKFLLAYSIGFAFSFAFVYWIGTKDLGLCFVIALALVNGTSAAQQELVGFGKNLVPVFESLDQHINALISEKDRLEEKLDELESTVSRLNHRIEELELKN